MIREMADWVSSKTGWTVGGDLFVGFRDESAPDQCVVLLQRVPGRVNFFVPERRDVPLQVLTRSTSYATAESMANEAFDLLHGKSGIALPGLNSGPNVMVDTAEATGTAGYLGQDERGRHEFSVNFIIRYHKED